MSRFQLTSEETYREPSRTFVADVTTVIVSVDSSSDTLTLHALSFLDEELAGHATTESTTPTLYCD
jgi:hypothetical protein